MHICKASSVGAKIYAEKIPIQKELHGITKHFEEQLEFALHGGEDFELLYTIPAEKNSDGENVESHAIGEITANIEIIELNIAGKARILEPKGFSHF
jgi:thiamine-monophosphate kinase